MKKIDCLTKLIDMKRRTSSDPQEALIVSFQLNDLKGFEAALHKGGSVQYTDPVLKLSLFEVICQTPDSGKFITRCVQIGGCSVDATNKTFMKRPINFIANDSKSFDNLEALLKFPGVDVNFAVNGFTPFHSLIASINNENFDEIFKCLSLLMATNADVNIPDMNGIPPILTLLQTPLKLKKTLVEAMMKHSTLNLVQIGEIDVKELVSDEFPELFFPTVKMQPVDVKKINFHYLSQLLDYKREEFFVKELNRYLGSAEGSSSILNTSDTANRGTLLHIAIRNQMMNAVEVLLENGADPNMIGSGGSSLTPIALCCEVGDWKILELLLKSPRLALQPTSAYLCIVVQRIEGGPSSINTNYLRCFYLLLNDPRVNVNGRDNQGNTALHLAIRSRNDVLVQELLKRGAYLGALNNNGESPITFIDPEPLERYMDSCLEEAPKGHVSTDAGLRFRYKSFLPPDMSNELAAINLMTHNRNTRHLIAHPLITTLLSIKWTGFAIFFNINLLIYSLFCIGLLMFVTLCYIYQEQQQPQIALILWCFNFFTYFYVTFVTLANLILLPRMTLRVFRCYAEILLIVAAFFVLFVRSEELTTRRIITATTVIISGVELVLLIYTIQSQFITTSLTYVKTFLMSLIHSFVLYCILIVVFSLSFWTNQSHVTADVRPQNPVVLTHLSPIAGIVKNAIHLMGEFDTSKVDLYAYAISYFIIFLFLVFVVIIIFNVFNKFMFSYAAYESFESVPSNLLIKTYHLHKTELLLSKFRLCPETTLCCISKVIAAPYQMASRWICLFSNQSLCDILIYPVLAPVYQVIILKRSNVISPTEGDTLEYYNKRMRLDRMTFHEARLILQKQREDRTQELLQEENLKILHRLEFKMDAMFKKIN